MNRHDFFNVLTSNNRTIVFFITGESCMPCKRAKIHVIKEISRVPYRVIQLDRTIDSDVYSALLSKKQIRGVPTLLAYNYPNTSMFANLSMSGSDPKDIADFFIQVKLMNDKHPK